MPEARDCVIAIGWRGAGANGKARRKLAGVGDQHGTVPGATDTVDESGVSGVMVPVGAGTRD